MNTENNTIYILGNGGAGRWDRSRKGALPKSNKCKQGGGGGSKFWSFCENVIIE